MRRCSYLFQYPDGIKMPDFLVMTSGNVSGAPICRSDEEALEELSDFCDCILSHNRKIRVRADDSVMDFYKNRPYMIRRSRDMRHFRSRRQENGKDRY